MADTMVQAGHFAASDWAEALGAELAAAQVAGKPDTLETYYNAALSALEYLMEHKALISTQDQTRRKADWRRAYLATPHGNPVELRGTAENS